MSDQTVREGEGRIAAPIVRRALHAELVDRLRDMIHDGTLSPGAKVPERALCEHFGVSRTPLREALKVLAAEALIKLTPNRGAAVAALTLADLEEVFPVMACLEALSGELACERITDEEIDEIRALHEEMVEHYRRRDLTPYFKLNQKIHALMLKAADNPTLEAMHRSLSGRIVRARYLANMSKKRWAEAVAEHGEILEALAARDAKRLSRLLREHVMHKFETVRETMLEG
ncbi:MAG: GntR family transcriptional regulator [Hyphomicrobiales bacterium]|nr:GntR family transcriptional regulator [Hyphomicrobiales bacterium]